MFLITLSLVLTLTTLTTALPVQMEDGIIDDLINFLDKLRFNSSYTGFDAVKNAKQLGYDLESHYIQTKDNYILRLDHILNDHVTKTNHQPPVLLVPGLLCSSACFLDLEKALGFVLADNNYDVWVANVRGTTFSRNHTTLDPNGQEFWEYSWHEIGVYDLPAMIDHILDVSGAEKVNYIGHSQGTTSFFVMTSMLPEYNQKINVVLALAPVAIMKHSGNLMYKLLAPLAGRIQTAFDKMNLYEVFPRTKTLTDYVVAHCSEEKTARQCERALFFQLDVSHMDMKAVPLIVSHYPGGASLRQFLHYAQLITSGTFHQYNYGHEQNMIHYNQTKAPEYHLDNVIAPVYLIYGNSDSLADERDVIHLSTLLPNVAALMQVNDPDFNHDDFCYKKNVYDILYKDLVSLLNKANNL